MNTGSREASREPHRGRQSRQEDKARHSSPVRAIASAATAVEQEFRKSVVFREAKRIVILLLGGTVLIVGVALIVLPGPAFLVIPAGLSILAVEFAWARRALRKARRVWESSKKRVSK